MQQDNIKISTVVSPALHPAVFDSIEGLTENTRPLVADAVEAFQAAYDGLISIDDIRALAASNSALTPDAKVLQVAAFADRKVAAIAAKIDAADAKFAKQIQFVEGELQRPLEATVHTSTAAEVRALARAMPRTERVKLITDAIASNDMPILSSMLGAHPLLSGLTPLEREMFTRRYREASQPGLTQRLAVMVKAKEMLNDRSGLVMKRAQELVGADRGKVAALRAAHAKFASAMAK